MPELSQLFDAAMFEIYRRAKSEAAQWWSKTSACPSALLAHTNTLASCIRLTCGPVENWTARTARTEKSPLLLSKAAKKPRKKIVMENKAKR